MSAKDAEKESLTFGFLPYLVAGEVMKKYTPLATYLSEAVGVPIAIVISKNYNEHIRQVGGVPYVKNCGIVWEKAVVGKL